MGKAIGNTAKVLGITTGEVFDAFAHHWVNVYGPRVYKPYYQGAKSAKEFFLRLDTMHARINKSVPNARTPGARSGTLDPRGPAPTAETARPEHVERSDAEFGYAAGAARLREEHRHGAH
jgi:hypothetical protein